MLRFRSALTISLLGWGLAACRSEATSDDSAAVDPNAPHPMPPSGDPSCDYKLTDFPGDCSAPPAVNPSVGYVAHYGPSDYDNPDELSDFLVAPGAEPVDCVYSTLSNESEIFYNRYDVHSRPGMHHVILYAMSSSVEDGLHDGCQLKLTGATLLGVVQGGIEGNVYRYPPSGEVAPENAGIATKLGAYQSVAYEVHAVNPNEYPLLKENWTVFYSMPPEDVTGSPGQIAFNGGIGMKIEPHSRATITNRCAVPVSLGPVRVLDFFGHMHAHGERFSAWVARQDPGGGETRSLVYETYDWSELDLIEFNTARENPPVEYQGGLPGGASGILELLPGDRIDYECEMNNTEDYALTFKARAFDGEMCNLFGSFTPGTSWQCTSM